MEAVRELPELLPRLHPEAIQAEKGSESLAWKGRVRIGNPAFVRDL
jgi:hypothetical protein